MYNIDSIYDTPDLQYLYDRACECMDLGIKIADTTELKDKVMLNRAESIKELQVRYGINNPNSPDQVNTALSKMNDPDINEVCIEKGKWSTKQDNLITLIKRGNEFAKELFIYRRLESYRKYIVQFENACDTHGLIHPTVTMGKTNRIQYSDPPLMSMPKKLLGRMFEPRKKGNVIYSIDVKNQEPWILINMLAIESLMYLLRDTEGAGIYNALYEKIYGDDPNKIQREEFKTSWNAMTYGCTKWLLTTYCHSIDPSVIWKYFNSIPELKEYRQECYRLAGAKVMTTETVFGSKLKLSSFGINNLARDHMNYKIQGTGVDILALLVAHFDDVVDSRGLETLFTLYFTRHDELLIEVDAEYIERNGKEKVVELLEDIFVHQIDDWTPFRVNIEELKPENIFMDDDFEEE